MHHESDDTFALTEYPSAPEYWVWSEREQRWAIMTFDEHRAWLTRPDLDPAEFASSEVAS